MKDIMLRTRQDAIRLFLDIVRPLKNYYGREDCYLDLGSFGVQYDTNTAQMESWARVLWGMGPLFAADDSGLPAVVLAEIEEWEERYRSGLIHGTDPAHPGYWGEIKDNDQKIVEVAPIVSALILAPDAMWKPLNEQQKIQVFNWLDQINSCEIFSNNWLYFRILTNFSFARLGMPFDKTRLTEDFVKVEECYLGDGWYTDGKNGRIDYYIPIAMYFYSQIWASFSPVGAGGFSSRIRERSALFARDYIHWFSDDGEEIPYGRSLIYRFAHSSFFSALALANVLPEGMSWGQIKHIIFSNIRCWLKYPIMDRGGVMNIGYHYNNPFITEIYNGPGSCYWALKTFLFLALPADHPFWSEEEEPVPHPEKHVIPKAKMILVHHTAEDCDHAMMYPVGIHCPEFGNSAAKYEKFVYSNRFGFSISQGQELASGAFDNVLAIALSGSRDYKTRYGVNEFSLTNDYTYSAYSIADYADVRTWIIPMADGWHVRIHRIVNKKEIVLADGGFSLPLDNPDNIYEQGTPEEFMNGTKIQAVLPWASVSATWLLAGGDPSVPLMSNLVRTYPNTNLMSPRCVVPTLRKKLPAGDHILANAFFGSVSVKAPAFMSAVPEAVLDGDVITVTGRNRKPIEIVVK